MLADFQRYYGLDLADVLRYRLSPRRVVWLAEHLPEESMTTAAIRGGREHVGWNVDAYLLAAVVDRLGAVWAAAAQQSSRTRVRPPAPIARPGRATPQVRVVTWDEL